MTQSEEGRRQARCVGYTCSYVPVEIIAAAGFRPLRLVGHMDHCCQEETGLSRNVCPYMHGVLRDFREKSGNIGTAVLTDSCDAMKKVYDVLTLQGASAALLSIPRTSGEGSANFFALQLETLYTDLCRMHNRSPDPERLRDTIRQYRRIRDLLERLREPGMLPTYADYFSLVQQVFQNPPEESVEELERIVRKQERAADPGIRAGRDLIPVITSGSPIASERVYRIIEEAGFDIVYNDSCLDRRWAQRGAAVPDDGANPFTALSKAYLTGTPCARMFDRKSGLDRITGSLMGDVKGIIHFRMPFCDLYGFDLVHLMSGLGKERVLSLETDGSEQSEGQIKTRVQAFAEMISNRRISVGRSERVNERNGNVFCGIDVGSTTVDGVIIDAEGAVVSHRIIKTGPRADRSSYAMLEEMAEEASLSLEAIRRIVATGYGRESLDFAQDTVTEISCHARGVLHLLPGIRFVIDIGGQDSKVIKIDEAGKVQDFQMNDKCAAGTGRFLEVMAGALEVDIETMSDLSLERGEAVPISSVCTVFAESEVISLLGKGHEPPTIVKGIYRSITNRIEGMVRRIGAQSPAAITGGGALNRGLVRHLEERVGMPFSSPEIPQIVGAVGAALYAREQSEEV